MKAFLMQSDTSCLKFLTNSLPGTNSSTISNICANQNMSQWNETSMDFLNSICFEDLELQNNFRVQFNLSKIEILNLCANNTEETGVGSLVWKVNKIKK